MDDQIDSVNSDDVSNNNESLKPSTHASKNELSAAQNIERRVNYEHVLHQFGLK